MTSAEAEVFLADREVRKANGECVCIVFYQRADGTIITRDCPVGLAAMRRRARAACARIAGLATILAGAWLTMSGLEHRVWHSGARSRYLEPYARIRALLNPPPPRVFMGDRF